MLTKCSRKPLQETKRGGKAAAGYGERVLLTVLVWGGLIATGVVIVRTLRSSGMKSPLSRALCLLTGVVMLVVLVYIGPLSGVR
jgi:hypothetical protein